MKPPGKELIDSISSWLSSHIPQNELAAVKFRWTFRKKLPAPEVHPISYWQTSVATVFVVSVRLGYLNEI